MENGKWQTLDAIMSQNEYLFILIFKIMSSQRFVLELPK